MITKTLRTLTLGLLVALASTAHANTDTDPISPTRTKIHEFISKFAGHKLHSLLLVNRIDNGTLEIETQNQFELANSRLTKSGLRFDLKVTKRHIRFQLDQQGHRVGQGVRDDSDYTLKFILSDRRSSGAVLGITYQDDDEGWETAVNASFDDQGRLVLLTKTATEYDDLYSGTTANGWKPGRIVVRYLVEQTPAGSLQISTTDDGFNYDLQTGQESSDGDSINKVYTE